MIRRPPRSTLFPYTDALPISEDLSPAEEIARRSTQIMENIQLRQHLQRSEARFRLAQLYVDRKSTRLNSSHQIISYAVFCLKKKIDIMPLPAPYAHEHNYYEP